MRKTFNVILWPLTWMQMCTHAHTNRYTQTHRFTHTHTYRERRKARGRETNKRGLLIYLNGSELNLFVCTHILVFMCIYMYK